MSTHTFFPTHVYQSALSNKASMLRELNMQLLKEILILSKEDKAGITWSKENYPHGFTSYASANQMHIVSPTFAELNLYIQKHLKKYIDCLELNIKSSALSMNTCWVNIMNKNALHSSHNHPQSIISGTYYVQVPRGSSALKFEDPRYSSYMSRPAMVTKAKNQTHHSLKANSSDVILFESWLRHEVPINHSIQPRISISFNYM